MKSFVAHSLVLLRLFTSAYALPTVPGNFSIALTDFQGAAGASHARSAFLKDRAPGGTISVSTYRVAVGVYCAEIGFGEPAISSRLQVDTGSSITWCKDYIETESTKASNPEEEFKIDYGGGRRGMEALVVSDQVTIGDLVIRQTVGAAFSSSDFDGASGILGLGPVGLTRETIVNSDPFITVPTVMNNLKSGGLISQEVFSLYYPSTAYSGGHDKGKLIFGGVDTSLYEGEIRYVPLTIIHPSSEYWGVDLVSFLYGRHNLIQYRVVGILDSGARLIYLTHDLFDAYRAAIPGAIFDPISSYLIEIPPDSIKYMQPLHFQLYDQMFIMGVDDQLLAPEVNGAFGGKPEKRYTVFCSFGPNTRIGSGQDFTLGVPFLKVYYTVYDTENRRVGIAKAKPTGPT